MSRVAFKTGKGHQEAAAVWARRRLADVGGKHFSSPNDQDGVLFADGVGMGKTWEALAAAALILYKQHPERGRRHVLILCPANLISKWEEELSSGSPFRRVLTRWEGQFRTPQSRVWAKQVVRTLEHVLPIRRRQHLSTKLSRGKFSPPGGTYLVSHGLIHRPGLAPLRHRDWDVVIVDEAHNAAAHNALESIQKRRRAPCKLLLTATPFQLDPRQWNGLARQIVKTGYKVFSRPEVRTYVDKVDAVFRAKTSVGPSALEVSEASATLRRIAARSLPRRANRIYGCIRVDGTEHRLEGRLDEFKEHSVELLLNQLSANGRAVPAEFQRHYLRERLRLAAGTRNRPMIATTLRRFLSTGTAECKSPRLGALAVWAAEKWAEDFRRSFESGLPHKTIVFTSWVGDLRSGEAKVLRDILESAFDRALRTFRRSLRNWARLRVMGQTRLQRLVTAIPEAKALVDNLLKDELAVALAGANTAFVGRVRTSMRNYLEAVDATQQELDAIDIRTVEARALRRRLTDMHSSLNPWSGGAPLRAVERYTGRDDRRARDRAAAAFRQIGPPWALVASNVGSEGIDLQTFTHRIVHYDLEWNPARMEQREGRGDRVGRLLKTDIEVFYCLVPGTYDERMFHQLVARDRWHGVLLGKPAKQIEGEDADAQIVARGELARMRLRLAP